MATKTKTKQEEIDEAAGDEFPISIRTATVRIAGIAPVSFSRPADDKLRPGEDPQALDERVWRDRVLADDDGFVMFNSQAMQFALHEGGKKCGKRRGGGTWTDPFKRAVVVPRNFYVLTAQGEKIHKSETKKQPVYCGANGSRTDTKRVTRNYPRIDEWRAEFDVQVFDPTITNDIFQRAVTLAGIYNGIGRYSPRVGGVNGRWVVESIQWGDNL